MALTTEVEVASAIEKVVVPQMQMTLNSTAVLAPTLTNLSFMAEGGRDRIDFNRMGNFSVSKKAAGVPVVAQTNALAADALDLDEHAVIQFHIEKKAELQSKLNIAAMYAEQASKDLASQWDKDIITELETASTLTISASDPNFATKKEQYIEAKRLADVNKIPRTERFSLVHPDDFADFLKEPDFVRVDAAGDSGAALRNGEIGRMFGWTIIESEQGTPGSTLWYHKSACAWARQLAPTFDFDKDLPNLATLYSVDQLYGQQLLDNGNRVIKLVP